MHFTVAAATCHIILSQASHNREATSPGGSRNNRLSISWFSSQLINVVINGLSFCCINNTWAQKFWQSKTNFLAFPRLSLQCQFKNTNVLQMNFQPDVLSAGGLIEICEPRQYHETLLHLRQLCHETGGHTWPRHRDQGEKDYMSATVSNVGWICTTNETGLRGKFWGNIVT